MTYGARHEDYDKISLFLTRNQSRYQSIHEYIKTILSSDFLIYWLVCAAFLSMPLGTSPPVICGGLAALVWIVSGKPIKQWRTYAGKSWFWPVVVLILLPWIGLLYTRDPAGFGIAFARKTHYWLYALVAAAVPFTGFPTERLIQAFLLGLAVNALVALLQLIGIFPVLNELAYGLGLGYSTMAAYLILGILMASYYFKHTHDQRRKILYGLLMVVYFFHLIILGGRTGFFTFFMLSPLILRDIFGRLKIWKMSLVYLGLAGIMLLSPVVWDRIHWSINQIKYHLNADPDSAWGREWNNKEERLYIWRGALEVFWEHPIAGVGTGGFPVVLHEKGNPDWPYVAHPHNNFLYMAVSFGVIGILALIWFFWEIFRNSWEERHAVLGYFVFSTALVMFITGIFNTEIIDAATAFLLALAVGLQNGFPRFSREVKAGVSEG